MMERVRAFELHGKRRQVRLEVNTWEAIDLIARAANLKWATLATKWAESDPDTAQENLTAVIRAGVMKAMLEIQKGEGIATATATATKTPGILIVDWRCKAACGSFLLNVESAAKLAKTLDDARLTAGADALESWATRFMPSEDEKEDDRRAERKAERAAEDQMEE